MQAVVCCQKQEGFQTLVEVLELRHPVEPGVGPHPV